MDLRDHADIQMRGNGDRRTHPREAGADDEDIM
jgi:hypothetical protein